jgi:hypothetical protein
MGRRAGVLASLTVLAASACSSAPGLSSTTSLDDVGDVSPASEGASGSAAHAAVTGTCLSGERLADSPDDMADAVSRFGLAAYQEMADDPIWTDTVDCSEPHTLEVYGAVMLPAGVAEVVMSYTDLLARAGGAARAIENAVDQACALAIPVASSISSKAPIDVDVIPLTNPAVGRFTWSPPPSDDWEAGDETIGCLFEQPQPGTTTVADLVSGILPVEQRICLDGTSFVPCNVLHDVERIAALRVDRAVAAHRLPGTRAVDDTGMVDLGDEHWSSLDTVCQNYLTAISGSAVSRLRGVTDTYPELYPDEAGHYTVLCTARSPFGTPSRAMTITKSTVYDA